MFLFFNRRIIKPLSSLFLILAMSVFFSGCSQVPTNPDEDFGKTYSEPDFSKQEEALLRGE